MKKLFIDTNIFEAKGLNFDLNNTLIKTIIYNVKNNNINYYNLSVIDGEISYHLKQKSNNSKESLLKNNKWIKKYINDDEINKNCFKNLFDYKKFKEECNAIDCDVSKINPEDIFESYFYNKPPFELKEKKKYEFPDAYISKYINEMAEKENDIVFITNDNGLKSSISSKVSIYSSLEKFFTDLNGCNPQRFNRIIEFVKSNLNNIMVNLLEKCNIECFDVEDEIIEVDTILLNDDFDLQVLLDDDNDIYINIIFKDIFLMGKFICLDYNNSYWPNDADDYCYKSYISSKQLHFENYEVNLSLKDENDVLSIIFDDKYNFKITYKMLCESEHEIFNYDDMKK